MYFGRRPETRLRCLEWSDYRRWLPWKYENPTLKPWKGKTNRTRQSSKFQLFIDTTYHTSVCSSVNMRSRKAASVCGRLVCGTTKYCPAGSVKNVATSRALLSCVTSKALKPARALRAPLRGPPPAGISYTANPIARNFPALLVPYCWVTETTTWHFLAPPVSVRGICTWNCGFVLVVSVERKFIIFLILKFYLFH